MTNKLGEFLKYHITDSTALLAASTAIYGAMEVGVAGMSDDVSSGSRLTTVGLTYLGIGWLYANGRDLSRKVLKITDKSRESIQSVHDSIYSAIFNGVACFPLYLAMGADVKQATIGSLISAGISIPLGPILGYSVDAGRDLMGLNENKRPSYPELVRKQRPSVKKGLAALLLAGSIAATVGVYALTPNEDNSTSTPQTIETQNK